MDVAEYTETFPSALPAARDDAFRAWVSIAPGCDNACTFCIVPLVRGPQRSRSIGDILAEVQGLVAAGVVEVTLLGQNVNTFGRDVTVPGSSRRPLFADLLRMVNQVDGLRRIRFTSPHPHDFTPDVIDAMAESEKVCEHIHFPLQSGSDRVLRAMRRSYRRDALPGLAGRGSATRCRASRSRRTSSWGSPARPRTTSRRRSRSSRRRGSTARTCSSTRPGPGRARRRWTTRCRRRSSRSGSIVSSRSRTRSPSERNREQVGRTFEVLVEGDRAQGWVDAVADPHEPHRAPGRAARRRGPSPTPSSPRPRTHHLLRPGRGPRAVAV